MDCNLKFLGETFQVVSVQPQKIDINGRDFFSLYLRLYIPFNVERLCCCA